MSSNPFDMISNELGIAQGIPRGYATTPYGMSNAAAAAAVGGQHLRLRGQPSPALPSAGRGGSSSKNDPNGVLNDKVERRRKREREAARRSRRRKQARMESLDKKVEDLEAENKRLHEQIKWADVNSLSKERDDLIAKIQRVLDAPSESEEAMGDLISAFNNVTEQIVNVNTKGATNIAASLDNSHLVNVILWMFISAKDADAKAKNMEDDDDPKDGEDDNQEIIRKIGSKMNDKIREDVGLDESQYNAILEARGKYYDAFKQAYDQNQQALALVRELEQKRASMAHYVNVTKSFREHVLQKVLSEEQQAKLLVWLHRHKNLLRHLFSSSQSATTSAA